MISPRLRLIAVLVAAVTGAVQVYRGDSAGWLLIAVAVLLAAGYVLYGTVALAFHAYRRGDLARVERELGRVWRRDWLTPESRAYFDLLSGVLAHERKELGDARTHLEAAVAGALRTENVRAVAHFHIAHVCLDAGDAAAAADHVRAARALRHAAALDGPLRELESKLPG